MTEHKADLSASVKPAGSLDAKVTRAKADDPRKTFIYVGYTESGDWETFSDELEASRFALKGSKARVEKRELLKRQK